MAQRKPDTITRTWYLEMKASSIKPETVTWRVYWGYQKDSKTQFWEYNAVWNWYSIIEAVPELWYFWRWYLMWERFPHTMILKSCAMTLAATNLPTWWSSGWIDFYFACFAHDKDAPNTNCTLWWANWIQRWNENWSSWYSSTPITASWRYYTFNFNDVIEAWRYFNWWLWVNMATPSTNAQFFIDLTFSFEAL